MEVLLPGCSDQGDRGAGQGHFGSAMNESIDDIDIEALLNRPRPLGRTRRRPLYKGKSVFEESISLPLSTAH